MKASKICICGGISMDIKTFKTDMQQSVEDFLKNIMITNELSYIMNWFYNIKCELKIFFKQSHCIDC